MMMTGISSLQASAPAAAMAAITANPVVPRSNQYRIATRKSIVKKSMKISCRRKREKKTMSGDMAMKSAATSVWFLLMYPIR